VYNSQLLDVRVTLNDEEKFVLTEKIPELIALITSEISSMEEKKEKWASFKRNHNGKLCELLGFDPEWQLLVGSLINFDLDTKNKLILLNYTAQAHNVLHEVSNGSGWTTALKFMRGLVYSYENLGNVEGIKLASRGFKKFFNAGEIEESCLENLSIGPNEKILTLAKEDGAMIEYFLHCDSLRATTRGKFNTVYVDVAQELFTLQDFQRSKKYLSLLGHELLSIVVELVHPVSKVLVDYQEERSVYLLAAFDTSGQEIPIRAVALLASYLEKIGSKTIKFPEAKITTLEALRKEINDRSVRNREGFVAFVGKDYSRLKFKYISYIGDMVNEKLSYKYVMNCLIKNRAEKMLFTLPEEVREYAYQMVDLVEHVSKSDSHASLYELYSEREGSVGYFRQVCRNYYKFKNIKNSSTIAA